MLGGCGAEYPKIYTFVDELAREAGLRLRIKDAEVAAGPTERALILETTRQIADRLSRLQAMDENVPAPLRDVLAGDAGDDWGSKSRVRAYLKGRQ